MGLNGSLLGGSVLELDLDSSKFEAVAIDYYSFTRIMEPDRYGVVPLENFGSGFEIRYEDGIYLTMQDEKILSLLTKPERDVIMQHPRGRPDQPVLAFPFTLRELKFFLDWAADAGHDFPINEGALLELIESQKIHPIPDTLNPAVAVNLSDLSLGAYTRERNISFANKNQERHDFRAIEHKRWRDAGEQIQRARIKRASLRQLAQLVKELLDLPDSVNTIRAHLPPPKHG